MLYRRYDNSHSRENGSQLRCSILFFFTSYHTHPFPPSAYSYIYKFFEMTISPLNPAAAPFVVICMKARSQKLNPAAPIFIARASQVATATRMRLLDPQASPFQPRQGQPKKTLDPEAPVFQVSTLKRPAVLNAKAAIFVCSTQKTVFVLNPRVAPWHMRRGEVTVEPIARSAVDSFELDDHRNVTRSASSRYVLQFHWTMARADRTARPPTASTQELPLST